MSVASPTMFLTAEQACSLRRSLGTTTHTSGSTHEFYKYPARFHPEVAREVIKAFSRPGEWILDPFMGGGTSVVEALSLGRRAIGCDINALARFVAEVRTRPLSPMDTTQVRLWAMAATRLARQRLPRIPPEKIVNLPTEPAIFLGGALELTRQMLPHQASFARAVLLRLGQLTLDCRDYDAPDRTELAERLAPLADEMLYGLDELVQTCRAAGVAKNTITRRRLLLHRSAVGVEEDPRLQRIVRRPRLVFTSPPYPGVHVLYHRWQYRGRRETPAPYWIANVEDGLGAAHYCGGSRTPTGLRNYFRMISQAFRSIARTMHTDGHIVQIVGFSDKESQLSPYLQVMEQAGLRDVGSHELGETSPQRRVANRKWYASIQGDIDPATEFLFVHRKR